ncbi:MAG: metallophosphoesterase [Vicinamibacterales bacterium]
MVVETRRWWRSACTWSLAMAIGASLSGAGALDLALPNKADSFKFAVIGDFGTGDRPSFEVAAQMAALRARFPFEIVITTGDNIIGDQDDPSDLAEKFERPFLPLLDAGVRFHASLGNHDKPANLLYPPFNMNGQRYYTFARKNVRFFVLDTNRLDRPQLAWLEQALRRSTDDWKICAFHHPLYSNGLKHGPSLELRVMLEPILVQHGVDAVFSGHDHFYERLKPQKGIHYFVAGAGGQHERDIQPSAATAASFDEDRSFIAVEVSGHQLYFQAVSRGGAIVDVGTIDRRPTM